MDDENKIVPLKDKRKSKRKSAIQKRQEAVSTPLGRDALTTALGEVSKAYNMPKVMSDSQLRDRLNGYLNSCYQQGIYPTVEEGLLSTGYSKQYMLDIAMGRSRGKYFTPEAAEIISKFLDICGAVDAKLVMTNVVPQIPYIYRSKNYYGMSDKREIQISGDVNIEAEFSVADIAKRYAVETGFAEDETTSTE